MRVVIEDGEGLMVTEDFCENRVNVEIKDGKIGKINFIG